LIKDALWGSVARIGLAGLALAFALGGVACSGDAEEVAPETAAARLNVPQQLVGLRISAEKIGPGLSKVDRPYVDTVAVFSLREEDLLRASLQISRFNGAARPDDRSFRESIVSTIGGATALSLRVANTLVYTTRSSDQSIFTWFDGDGMFVLAVQREFRFPRTLLRRMIELELTV
jgi:hypothetical protein